MIFVEVDSNLNLKKKHKCMLYRDQEDNADLELPNDFSNNIHL